MSPHQIEEKLLPKFVKYLFKGYVDKFGYSKASLDKHEIPITLSNPPKEFCVETPNGAQRTCVHYFSELKAQGFLTQQGGFYKLTDAGYSFGYECLHPVKTFHKNHWRWLYGSLIIGP